MRNRLMYLGICAGLVGIGAGCASDDKTAQKPKGTYIHARHMQVGSNIPQPNRGASGADDVAEVDMEREQFQHFQSTSGSAGMARDGGH